MTSASPAMDAPEIDGLWGLRPSDRPFLVMPANARDQPAESREFIALAEDHYRQVFPHGISFDLSHLRRDRSDLVGELTVLCAQRGPRGVGLKLTGSFNVNSLRSRAEWLRSIADRVADVGLTETDWWPEFDWWAKLENFCALVREADRDSGEPLIDLRALAADDVCDIFDVDGFRVLRRHPTIFFGDGGTLKSYYVLYLLGRLAEQGERVLLIDWELDGNVHQKRMRLLFGSQFPQVSYVHCLRPLVDEVDRLRRMVEENNISFCVYDSVVFGCSQAPETAEAAGEYFRCVRQIGGGSLLIAHTTKTGKHADEKPFGSVFWHNGARATWHAQATQDLLDDRILHLRLENKKANLEKLQPPLALTVTFGTSTTTFARALVQSEAREVDSKTAELTELLRDHPGIGQRKFEKLASEQGLGRNKTRAFIDNGMFFGTVRQEVADDGKTFKLYLVEVAE